MEERLRKLQRLLYKVITAPEGVESALETEGRSLPAGGLSEIIVGDERLGPAERLAIYADAYFYRLLECLKDDFPAVAGMVGAERFHELIRGYLAACPPFHSSVVYAGQFLPDFLRGHRALEQWPFLAEVARLEWSLIEVFQAPDAVTLKAQDLRAIASERWPELHLRTPPALRLVDCRWRVAEALRAIREPKQWQAPEPVAQSLVVWRLNGAVYYREIAPAERNAFSLLAEGASFAAVCEKVAAVCPEGEAIGEINRMLERWLDEGCLMLEDKNLPPRPKPAPKRPPDGPAT